MENLPSGKSPNDNGYWFEPKFYLFKNIALVNDTFKTVYSDYEIAGYFNGITVLNIPFTAIAGILKEPFKHEIELK